MIVYLVIDGSFFELINLTQDTFFPLLEFDWTLFTREILKKFSLCERLRRLNIKINFRDIQQWAGSIVCI